VVNGEDFEPFGLPPEIETPAFQRHRNPGTVNLPDRGHSPRTFPSGEDLDIPTFLRKQMD
jgi:hypothetical protein